MKIDFSYGSLGYSILHAIKLTLIIFGVGAFIGVLIILSDKGLWIPALFIAFIGTVIAFTWVDRV